MTCKEFGLVSKKLCEDITGSEWMAMSLHIAQCKKCSAVCKKQAVKLPAEEIEHYADLASEAAKQTKQENDLFRG